MLGDDKLGFSWYPRRRIWLLNRVVFGLWIGFVLLQPVVGLRPLRERTRSWDDEVGIPIA